MKDNLLDLFETCVQRINAWERHLYCHTAWHDHEFFPNNSTTNYIMNQNFSGSEYDALNKIINIDCNPQEIDDDNEFYDLLVELADNHHNLGEYLAERWRNEKRNIIEFIEENDSFNGVVLMNKKTSKLFAVFTFEGGCVSFSGDYVNRTSNEETCNGNCNIEEVIESKKAEGFSVEYTFKDGNFED